MVNDGGYLRALAYAQLNLPHGTKQKKTNEETETKNRDAQKKRSSHKAVESVLRTEGSLWWERFEEKVGLERRGFGGWVGLLSSWSDGLELTTRQSLTSDTILSQFPSCPGNFSR